MKIITWLFDVNLKRQIPPIITILVILNASVFLISENTWNSFGVDIESQWADLPELLQYQLIDMEYKNAAYVFWILLPIVFFVNFITFTIRYNIFDYAAQVKRREKILIRQGKNSSSLNWSIILMSIVLTVGYLLALFFGRTEPVILHEFLPTKNRLALVTIHGGVILILLPLAFTVLVTEVRAGLSVTNKL